MASSRDTLLYAAASALRHAPESLGAAHLVDELELLRADLKDDRSSAQRLADARRKFLEAHGITESGDPRTHQLVWDAIGAGFYAAPVAKMFAEDPPGMIVGPEDEPLDHTPGESDG